MGFLDYFQGGEEHPLILDVMSMEQWPDKLLRRQGLQKIVDQFVGQVEQRREEIGRMKGQLHDPSLKERLPERAEPIFDLHIPLLTQAVEELLNEAAFINDPFLLEEQQGNFQDALALYYQRTQKSIAALKEFFGPELEQLQASIRALEDEMAHLLPKLHDARFSNVHQLKQLIDEYKGSRSKERKALELQQILNEEIEILERKRMKIKEKIRNYIERAHNSEFQELIAEEGKLMEEMDEIKERVHGSEELDQALAPIRQRIAFLRKQMISDVTALNINEQRTFLESVKDDLLLRKRKMGRVDELLQELHYQAYKKKFEQVLEPFNVEIEDADTIFEREEEDVAPQ